MKATVATVIVIHMCVNYLLLLGAARVWSESLPPLRACLSSALVTIHAGGCLLPGFGFLGHIFWRVVFLSLAAWLAFGTSLQAVGKISVFLLLHLALSGIMAADHIGGLTLLPLAAVGVYLLCWLSKGWGSAARAYVPVELRYRDKHIKLTALRDTGNTLKDPVTGSPVLVVGEEVAAQLLGLSKQQLLKPVEALAQSGVPGLRLIPYRAVGQPCGMLLAMRLQEVTIGKQSGSSVVAFAPQRLGEDGTFQALTGGVQ